MFNHSSIKRSRVHVIPKTDHQFAFFKQCMKLYAKSGIPIISHTRLLRLQSMWCLEVIFIRYHKNINVQCQKLWHSVCILSFVVGWIKNQTKSQPCSNGQYLQSVQTSLKLFHLFELSGIIIYFLKHSIRTYFIYKQINLIEHYSIISIHWIIFPDKDN